MHIIETAAYKRIKQSFVEKDVNSPEVNPNGPPQPDIAPTTNTDKPVEPTTQTPYGPDDVKSEVEAKAGWWRYGQYCGPGPIRDKSCVRLKDSSPLPAPLDKVDCACMEHDYEYCKNGLGWQEAYTGRVNPAAIQADMKLIGTLQDLLKKGEGLNWKERMAAQTIAAYFKGRHRILR